MDIHCPICLEPWDLESITDGNGTRPGLPQGWQRLADFAANGCRAIDRAQRCNHTAPGSVDRLELYAEIVNALAGDLDGMAAEMADAVTAWHAVSILEGAAPR